MISQNSPAFVGKNTAMGNRSFNTTIPDDIRTVTIDRESNETVELIRRRPKTLCQPLNGSPL
jgi:hypothetical protein